MIPPLAAESVNSVLAWDFTQNDLGSTETSAPESTKKIILLDLSYINNLLEVKFISSGVCEGKQSCFLRR